ncbi:glycoside hydrolase family 5 protein [Calocera viscosa TUFC12733]|uniref:mannan endo-1,4-beta-mannosidase n=1 Tax=Calocera viscosa (strain TUFC12733) TaxID=1330018 RepID=A0A167KZ22_CALVF|nr:glycoside hydrolase family 5 protein [Calocera viscosa TUFC12733]
MQSHIPCFLLALLFAVGVTALVIPASNIVAHGVRAAVAPPAVPASNPSTVEPGPVPNYGFIHPSGGHLYDGLGNLWDFATFNSPHLLTCEPFEVDDTMRTLAAGFARPVTRTYVLQVTSINIDASDAHIVSWDNTTMDWVYNEAMFQQMDYVLATAAKYGVKVVHPIINQDYGSQDSNYAGNWADLIRMRYGFATYEDTYAVNWFADPVMLDSFKLIITYLLNRVNTVNGVRYGDDPTFLAHETGNEMNYLGYLPAPGNWTVAVAAHIKSLAPNTMVLDGSLARNNYTDESFALEALQSPLVDLFSYHYYRDNPPAYDYRRINADSAYVQSFGKTYVVGEHGFYANYSEYEDFYQRQKESNTAGAMVWSIRPHSAEGGFITHGEGDGIFSYHAPGWSPQQTADFDPLELGIIHITRRASYTMLDEPTPAQFPIPNAPEVWVANNGTSGTGLSWRGGAWAQHYEVWSVQLGHLYWVKIATYVLDDVDAGDAYFTIDASAPEQTITPTYPTLPTNAPNIAWSDPKLPQTTGHPGWLPFKREEAPAARDAPQPDLNWKSAFYMMRGVSVDGIAGPFSNVVIAY